MLRVSHLSGFNAFTVPPAAAGITFVAGSSFLTPDGSNGSGSTPSGMQEDDILVVIVATDNALDPNGIQTSGYTDLVAPTTTSVPGYQISYKIMGATPDTTISVTPSTGRRAAVSMCAFRGVDTTTPIDNGQNLASGTGTPNAASHTTVTDGAMRILTTGIDDDNTGTLTAPSGYTQGAEQLDNLSASGQACYSSIDYKLEATAGADDPDAHGGTLSDQYIVLHFALRPA